MVLSDSLVWMMEVHEISGVKVFCKETVCDEVAKFFLSDFTAGWMAAVQKVEEEYGECEDEEYESDGVPVEIVKKDYGFFISVGALEVRYSYGDYYDSWYSFKAFEKALKNMKDAYPGVEYEGYIDYILSDVHSGEAVHWEIASKSRPKVYDFVGETIGKVLADVEKLEESDFWDNLSNELECHEDFGETIKVLYAYSEWINNADLNQLVKAILDLAEEIDGDKAEELAELVERLEAGEVGDEYKEGNTDVETEDNLPDGYMEALEMFLMADEIGGVIPKRGEVLSSEGTFDIVIAEAEAGDAKAKLTAGKYFIADHIEGETERAIRWIREAADAGIKDATDYIAANISLFKDSTAPKTDSVPTGTQFEGKIFVLTGLDSLEEQIVSAIIVSRGGVIKSSTVLKTDYLIFNPTFGRQTKKYLRAQELIKTGKNIVIIPVEKFIKTYGQK